MKKYFFIVLILFIVFNVIINQYQKQESKTKEENLLIQVDLLDEQNDQLKDKINSRPEEIRKEIEQLSIKRNNIVDILGKKYLDLSDIMSRINSARQELDIINMERQKIYLVCIKLKQKRIDDVDIVNRLKDEMDSVEFWIAVDKRLYDNINKGDSLFKEKTLAFKQVIYNWEITIKDKKTNQLNLIPESSCDD
jgi:hypothetical protein